MKQAQISASTTSLPGYRLEDAAEAVRRLGFKSVGLLAAAGARNALGTLPGYFWHYLDVNEMNSIREAVRGFEIVSVHAPYQDLPLVSYCADVCTLSRIVLQKSIESAPYLGGSTVTFHLEPPPFFTAEQVWESMLTAARNLAKHAKIFGLKVCIESRPRLNPDTFLRLVDAIDAPNLGATLDLGSTARAAVGGASSSPQAIQQANDCIISSILALGSSLYHVHAHDVREDWSTHHEVGTGILDWARIIAALDEIGYAGAVEVEIEEDKREEALWNSREALERFVKE